MTMARPPVLVIPGRERYHEVTLNVWAVLLGIAYLLGAPAPSSMAALVPDPWRYMWAGGLAVGGALALAGSYWLTDVERGLELERAGLVMLTGALLVYSTAVAAFAGWSGMMAAGIAAAWMWANVRRAYAITRDLQDVKRYRTDKESE